MDVGCRNWSYAAALGEAFPRARLLGVEVDGGRRYWDLYRRRDLAEAYASDLRKNGREAKCLFRDFRKISKVDLPRGEQVAFCFFFPFVSARPCVKWGLPLQFVAFDSLLEHSRTISEKSMIMSCHQGEWEAEIAKQAYESNRITADQIVIAPDEFTGLWPAQHPIHILTYSLV